MTPAVRAKELGLDNLQSLINFTGVKRDRLHRWVNDEPKLFDSVVIGYLTIQVDTRMQSY